MHPRLFQFGHFIIPTYGVLIALGLLAALWVCNLAARTLDLDTTKVWNLALASAVVTLAGAKLILTLVRWPEYGPAAIALDLAAAPGAMVAGALLGIAAGWLYAWRAAMPLRRTADALAPALAAGGAIAWIARLEAGYAFGSVSHGPLAVVFSDPLAAPGLPLGIPLHPVQIYGALVDFVLFVLLFALLRLPHNDGEVMGAWLFLNGLGSFFLTLLRGDDWAQVPVAGFLSGSQWLSVALVLAGGLLWLRHNGARKMGRTGTEPRPLYHAE